MDKLILNVSERKTTGKKVKSLRNLGLLPANIFGKTTKSVAIQVPLKDFLHTFKKAGETALVYLKIENEKEERPTLIKNIQLDPVSDQFIHADFHQVSLKEKVTAHIPVVAIGIAKAVSDKIGALLEITGEVEVEALPTDLPENFEVDVTNLAQIEDAIKIKDLKVDSSKVTILTDLDTDLFRIETIVSKEAEELAKEEADKAALSETPQEGDAQPSSETQTETPAETPKEE